MKLAFDVFPDVYAFREAVTNRPFNGLFQNEAATRNEPDFMGMAYEKALTALTDGVPADVERMKRETARFTAKTAPANRRKTINYYNGYAPNVPAALMGLPKSMRKHVNRPAQSKVVTLIYSMGGLGNVKAETLTACACTAVKLAAYLEINGYRVNLYSCPSMAEVDGEAAACVIKLKDSRQPFDIGKISFSMGNVAMFRRLGWRWRETCTGLSSKDWYWGYGRTIYEHEKATELLQKMGVMTQNAYYFNIKDCKAAGQDAEKLAARLGIVKRKAGD